MSKPAVTMTVVFGVTAALIAYDVWAAFTPGATISEVMLVLAHNHPIIPFALGVLMGHFFWSQRMESHWQDTQEARSRGLPPPAPTWRHFFGGQLKRTRR